ncbi:hypothetical protein FRB91_006307 [Serendipita sp. 411]|nr:hypothetical protein FRC19_008559 [Serendipita sp. 401]KAG8852633.1 hypothetical protein FRB91_006307 [Serendipita sp. 411]KAG9048523.1 hypothetical protein FS842_000383 [Serendipita sp. 407]
MPANNPEGNNQHGGRMVFPPDWVEILQDFRRRILTKADMQHELKMKHGIQLSDRKLQYELSAHTSSVRKPQQTLEQGGAELVALIAEDPHRQWGSRRLREKLAARDIHLPRDFINEFLKVLEPQQVINRHPRARAVHRHGLHSIGPNEEWSVDGHDKLVTTMGIGIWGAVDKFSRLVVSHFAVPNNRLADTALACYILLIQKAGGIPLCVVSDKGSETGKMHAVQVALRNRYAPDIDNEQIPAFKHVTSKSNITVERQWRPLYRTVLANILVFWLDHEGVYHSENPLHQAVGKFVWAKIVQTKLDQAVEEHSNHKIRKQKERNLPSGNCPKKFYMYPEEYGGTNWLIHIPEDDINLLVAKYVPEDLFFFCDNIIHHAATAALVEIGAPTLTPQNGWEIFSTILPIVSTSMIEV